MNAHIDFTKNYSSLPGEEMTLEAKFQTFLNITGSCGISFHNALLSTENTLEVICEVYTRLEKKGFPSDELSIGLISSKVLDEKELLALLWWKRFAFIDCATAMVYYGSKKLLLKIIDCAKKRGYTRDLHRIALYAGGNDLPAAEFVAAAVSENMGTFH
jgi:hypothetical protein